MIESDLDQRPLVVAIAGSNGAGKSTFYTVFLQQTGLKFINADVLAKELGLEPYVAASAAEVLRREYIDREESFIFETVLSDPVGAKVDFLAQTAAAGFNVVLCFIAIRDPMMSKQRVSMRVSQGGHDVPDNKLESRYPRTLANLRLAIEKLPRIYVYDNSDLVCPYKLVAVFNDGKLQETPEEIPSWIREALKL